MLGEASTYAWSGEGDDDGEEGDEPLDPGVCGSRADLVRAATQLRKLVRVKIADENDLAQAQAAVEAVGFHDFFSSGATVAQILRIAPAVGCAANGHFRPTTSARLSEARWGRKWAY